MNILLRNLTISVVLGGLGSVMPPIAAQTCASNCGTRPLQFTPGQAIRLQVANHTSGLVQVEQVSLTDTIPLPPGAEVEVMSHFGTEPNTSVLFWDETSLAVKAVPSRPEPTVLRIELLPGAAPGDRAVYMEDDGRVRVF